ncbi:MAG: HNH endonuclease [Flavobacteriales bacterium]|nr:HNH endonuclease [Flavobacteriales bacterium]
MSKTAKALMARGLDRDAADSLVRGGYTLASLKLFSQAELIDLGLQPEMATELLAESRPPIPPETMAQLLYESRWTCCVCRDRTKSVIVHHLEEWHDSRDHSEGNLVVLCLQHHDEAHTKRTLSLNLTIDRIREMKKLWLEQVRLADTQTIIGLGASNPSRWFYFNHARIFDLFLARGIGIEHNGVTATVMMRGLINDLGTFGIPSDDKHHIYNFGDGHLLYQYTANMFDRLLSDTVLLDLTDKFNKTDIKALLKPGMFIALQAAFYFSREKVPTKGPGQVRKAHYRRDGIELAFEFDAYEVTSMSAWAVHLSGHKVALPIGQVTSIVEEDGMLTITISCYAIGCFFDEHPYRAAQGTLVGIE